MSDNDDIEAVAERAIELMLERSPQAVGLVIRGEYTSTGNPIDDEASNAAHALINLAALADLSFTAQRQVIKRMQHAVKHADPEEKPYLQLLMKHTTKLLYDTSADHLEETAKRLRGHVIGTTPPPVKEEKPDAVAKALKWLREN